VRLLLVLCVSLALLGGCSPDKHAETLRSVRRGAHTIVTSSLVVLEAFEHGNAWPRFAGVHLEDARKNLVELRGQLKKESSPQALELDQRLEQIDRALQGAESTPEDAAAVAKARLELQSIEPTLRDPAREQQ
jgi:hypothetical protein